MPKDQLDMWRSQVNYYINCVEKKNPVTRTYWILPTSRLFCTVERSMPWNQPRSPMGVPLAAVFRY